ncbi:UDP-3-O-(3-hydroxymyristoyl)glucosamine N-acyltransferase [Marinilongibacter aquaticus]|uniref:UDP-3-O-(3-hydroxymyristoyl)glucosamine N-acyltransferase n=1 Tax=Marinilongibacter aquaticus TaxID=2975157 RepID=UPI0021BDA9F1|nr:UDP-3-O-(3-hydroxymyristoyl)glucosamine N-acyltransferase [Marinilongibacter aquaticus]UBM59363.1 UDP-3-O-(3-hydroxymyristoyl)glucosamine N-acyltransferase [Marinilongibacter aquaticus]
MKFTVRQIANLIGGEVEGDDNLEVDQFYKIEEGKAGGISFLANPKYEPHIYQTDSSAVIVSENFIPKQAVKSTLIKVKDPYSAFTVLLTEYEKFIGKRKVGIEQPIQKHESVILGENVFIGAFTYLDQGVEVGTGTQISQQVYLGENVKLGTNCLVHPGVKIYAGTEIGNNCIIHSGTVIGCDGFGFAPQEDGSYKSIPQLGNVKIGNDVSIGANVTIDRATMGSTIIGNGVKVDNLVQIAHNVTIGEHTVIASQTGIAGSSKVGKNCVVGGQVGVVGHIEIADGTKIGAQSGISGSIKETNTSVTGTPHFDLKKYLKSQVYFRRLPEFEKRISELEEKIKN